MKRTFFKTIFVFLISYCSLVLAQDLSKIENGKYLKNAVPVNSDWSAVPDLVAIESRKISKVENRKKVSKLSNIEFYEKSKMQVASIRTLQAVRSSTGLNEKAVVYNQDRKMLGVLTGNLILKVKHSSDLDLVIKDHGASIVKSYEKIGRAIIKFGSTTNIETKLEEIKQDSRVKNVEYDILTDRVEAH